MTSLRALPSPCFIARAPARAALALLAAVLVLGGPPAPCGARADGDGDGDGDAKKAPDAAGDEAALEASRAALAVFNGWVGEWKGSGMPRRGVAKGAWFEEVAWAWTFDGGRAALVLSTTKAKYWAKARLDVAEDAAAGFTFVGTREDGVAETFRGKPDAEGTLVLDTTAATAEDGRPARVSIWLVAEGKRMVMKLEAKVPGGYGQIAEIGLTKKGSGFGKGVGEPECIITGGLGTIPVSYNGQSYLVCCSGCKDLFEKDPERALAKWRARKAEERAREKEDAKD